MAGADKNVMSGGSSVISRSININIGFREVVNRTLILHTPLKRVRLVLITKIEFLKKQIYIKFVLTNKECDKNSGKESC